MMSRPRSLARRRLARVLSCAALLALADELQPEPPVVESFNGKLRLKWKVVRPDAKRYSLTKNKGKLTITTQKGTIHKDSEPQRGEGEEPVPDRQPLRPRPPTSRSASASATSSRPHAYQQAGLMLYDDDDNYLKFVWESNGDKNEAPTWCCSPRPRASPTYDRAARAGEQGQGVAAADAAEGQVRVRLQRRRQEVDRPRRDGGEGPAKIGILAKNGGTDPPEIDVCFEDFRARPLIPAKAKKD